MAQNQKMLKQMQKMQADMARVQAELQEETVEAAAGGGAVVATVTGGLELVGVKIDAAVVDPEDVELLEDTVVAAVNEAMRKAQELANSRLGSVAGGLSGLGLPGL
jgi:DNA-binding YbaB/EbfC family protein